MGWWESVEVEKQYCKIYAKWAMLYETGAYIAKFQDSCSASSFTYLNKV